jgi:hypothetical protein
MESKRWESCRSTVGPDHGAAATIHLPSIVRPCSHRMIIIPPPPTPSLSLFSRLVWRITPHTRTHTHTHTHSRSLSHTYADAHTRTRTTTTTVVHFYARNSTPARPIRSSTRAIHPVIIQHTVSRRPIPPRPPAYCLFAGPCGIPRRRSETLSLSSPSSPFTSHPLLTSDLCNSGQKLDSSSRSTYSNPARFLQSRLEEKKIAIAMSTASRAPS